MRIRNTGLLWWCLAPGKFSLLAVTTDSSKGAMTTSQVPGTTKTNLAPVTHELRFLLHFLPSRDAEGRQEKMLTPTGAALPYAVCVGAWIFIANHKTINETPSGN